MWYLKVVLYVYNLHFKIWLRWEENKSVETCIFVIYTLGLIKGNKYIVFLLFGTKFPFIYLFFI